MEILKNLSSENLIADTKSQNSVLRNTYLLLSATLFFSAITATTSALLKLPHPGIVITLVGYFGLLFLTSKLRNSTGGIYSVFALTGFMGYSIGPIVGAYWAMAPAIVMQAMAGTAAIFLGLSTFATSSKRDFNFLGPSLMIGVIVAFLISIGALVFKMPGLSLAVSAMFVILMSGMILYEVNQIMRGGETNYIMATVTLFVSIFNLFASLLHLLGFAQSE
ncbi:MAG: modulator of FtsH protease [Candidatus Azotimanducaceae bacterium]|jgi:modulator of FtsH protease